MDDATMAAPETATPPLNTSQSTLPAQSSENSTQILLSSTAADNHNVIPERKPSSTSTAAHDAHSPDEQDEQEEEEDPYPHGVHLAMIILGLVLTMLLAVMDMTILATAIPPITDQFHSLDDVGWYASVFFMTVASSQSTWGKAYKYFDLKTVFLLTIFIFELGSLICGIAFFLPFKQGRPATKLIQGSVRCRPEQCDTHCGTRCHGLWSGGRAGRMLYYCWICRSSGETSCFCGGVGCDVWGCFEYWAGDWGRVD